MSYFSALHFKSDHFSSNQFLNGAAVVAPTIPTPTQAPIRSRVGGGGGLSFLTPWNPLGYRKPTQGQDGCPPGKYPDHLEVLCRRPQVEEKFDKGELKALRRAVGKLKEELKVVGQLKEAHAADQAKIDILQKRIDALEAMKAWPPANARWAPTPWRPTTLPLAERLSERPIQEAPAPQPVPPTVAVVLDQSPREGVGEKISEVLPYAGVAAITALATYYLVDDEEGSIKFAGYSISLISLGLGLRKLLVGEAAPPNPR